MTRRRGLLVLGLLLLIGAFAPSAQAQSVTNVSVTNTSPSDAAGARTVYSITFTTTDALPSTGTITINFPAGTNLGTMDNGSVLNANAQDVGACSEAKLTVTCSLSSGIAASATVTVQLDGVTNPAASPAGALDALQVATSADTTSVSGFFTVATANTLTKLSASNSSPSDAAGARTVYTIEFDTSGTGGLSAMADSQITITFPTGTNLSTVDNSSVLNAGGTDIGSCSESGLTATCGFSGGDSIGAGSEVMVQLDGVTNPPVNPTGGQWTLSVATTSDTSAQSANFTVVSAGSITKLSATINSPSNAAGARTVYSIQFDTSGTGAMSAAADSQITITFPTGTNLATVDNSSVLNAANTDIGSCSESGLTATCGFSGGDSIGAGSQVTVQLDGVTNPSGGSQTLTAQTTSDPTQITSSPYSVTAAHTVTQPTVSLSNGAPGATGVNYTISFNTSSTGGLSAAADSQITITFPSGTNLSTVNNSSVLNAASTDIGSCSESGLTATCGFAGGDSVGASGALTVQLNSVTNPSSTENTTLTVATTSDPASVTSSPYGIGSTPTVTGVSPASGPTAGGTSVTITGTNLTAATAVKFGSTSATGFTVNSATTITATSPAAATGTVDITVAAPGGTSTTSAADQFTYVAPPTVTAVSPSSGPTGGGTVVTITGTGFTNATAVRFGLNGAISFTVNSATSISATSPSGTAGTVDVTVTTPGGTSATGTADDYTYLAAPTVTGVSPTAGTTAGGTSVTITGTNLTGATAVRFGTNPATNVSVVSATTVTATAPAGTAGTVDVTVTTPGATSSTGAADRYTYTTTPTVTAVSPTAGPTAGGTTVTITGANLAGATAVKFGSTAATSFTVNSATSVTATSPAGSAASVDVTVTTPGGTSATSAADHYTYTTAPTVTAVSPTAGPTAGGTPVTITGTNLTGASAVKVGANAATNVSVVSATTVVATAPAASAGTVDVTVTALGGTSATSAADHYTYVAAPTIAAIAPTAGPAAGGTPVTITGTNLTGASAIKFGPNPATNITVVNPTTVSATSPPGTGLVDVTAITPGGMSLTGTPDHFTYVQPAPTVSGISPSSGPAGGGTAVTVTGTNLTGATPVDFGPNPATNVTVVSASQITATSPPGSGTVDVTVTTPGGTSATGAADQFSYASQITTSLPAVQTVAAPAVSGGSATTQTSTGAGLSGLVDPEGLATTAYFEYGLDPSNRGPGSSTTLYDQSTPVQQVGSDSSNHALTAQLSGLVPGALYHIRVVATNSAGTTFGPDQTFTTSSAPAPPAPTLGQTENVQTVSGSVFIKLPSGVFVKLTGNQQITSGAEIDALHGSLGLTTATGSKGKTQHGVFGGAVFKVVQARGGATRGFVTLSIVESAFSGAPSYSLCTKHPAGDATAAALSSKTLQLLHASAHGKFTTKGRYSAATVRGTIWTIADRCDGTLVHDVTDSVAVNDFVHHKTIILHAGQSYLAKAPPK